MNERLSLIVTILCGVVVIANRRPFDLTLAAWIFIACLWCFHWGRRVRR